jgi:hypothetical protein
LMEAYPLQDENDNAAANRQVLAFRDIARVTNAGVVIVHNSGLRRGRPKNDPSGDKFMGRGATSRVDRADVSINFTITSQTERLLTVKKSRAKNLGQQIKFQFAGQLGYALASGADGSAGSVSLPLKAKLLEIAREEAAAGRPEITRKTFMEKLGVQEDSGPSQAIDRTLADHHQNGTLPKVRKGVYRLPDEPSTAEASTSSNGHKETGK